MGKQTVLFPLLFVNSVLFFPVILHFDSLYLTMNIMPISSYSTACCWMLMYIYNCCLSCALLRCLTYICMIFMPEYIHPSSVRYCYPPLIINLKFIYNINAVVYFENQTNSPKTLYMNLISYSTV